MERSPLFRARLQDCGGQACNRLDRVYLYIIIVLNHAKGVVGPLETSLTYAIIYIDKAKMANVGRQMCCHAVGLALTAAAIVLLVLGFVLMIVFTGSDRPTGYWVAVAALSAGALLAAVTSVYACYALKNKWKLYGFVNMKFAKKQQATEYAQTIPNKTDVDNLAEENGYATHVGGQADNFQPEWDPETILTERY